MKGPDSRPVLDLREITEYKGLVQKGEQPDGTSWHVGS